MPRSQCGPCGDIIATVAIFAMCIFYELLLLAQRAGIIPSAARNDALFSSIARRPSPVPGSRQVRSIRFGTRRPRREMESHGRWPIVVAEHHQRHPGRAVIGRFRWIHEPTLDDGNPVIREHATELDPDPRREIA